MYNWTKVFGKGQNNLLHQTILKIDENSKSLKSDKKSQELLQM